MNLKGTKTEKNLQEGSPVCDHPQSYFQLKPENY
jgi:hypothetical protein